MVYPIRAGWQLVLVVYYKSTTTYSRKHMGHHTWNEVGSNDASGKIESFELSKAHSSGLQRSKPLRMSLMSSNPREARLTYLQDNAWDVIHELPLNSSPFIDKCMPLTWPMIASRDALRSPSSREGACVKACSMQGCLFPGQFAGCCKLSLGTPKKETKQDPGYGAHATDKTINGVRHHHNIKLQTLRTKDQRATSADSLNKGVDFSMHFSYVKPGTTRHAHMLALNSGTLTAVAFSSV